MTTSNFKLLQILIKLFYQVIKKLKSPLTTKKIKLKLNKTNKSGKISKIRKENENMIALVTGASSGIGRDIARELAKRGYNIIAVARNEEALKELKNNLEKEYDITVDVRTMDLIDRDGCRKLHEDVKNKYGTIDILVNDAGFGTCGKFTDTDLDKELGMIDTNIVATHILTKLFLKDMVEVNKGYILNVASIAGFMPGPLMATYYSTKSYVVRLTQSIRQELFMQKSKVKISCLCPGPVKTNFNKVADVKFNLKEADSKQVAKYAVKLMFRNRTLIFPSPIVWLGRIFSKILPDQVSSFFCYYAQKRKVQ